ncbi:LysR family transcriptional regulator [Bradyrhizobium sp. CCGB12]|uniref:LysR family transcriptional regulator n=1 Tax=Bradyrhizobium sp. CCGB12 TaxID=2949632 RepID=UPI0020B36DFE|nr:LysR family transcriptional regulator [Bradyrhizobium sp. CCGB12]MCP3387739.1 LysR family transcriptional regulator [Bradyrhizobium sp. CCGB12]
MLFLQVAEAGSFSKAATSLAIGQPILSRDIKALEDKYGVQLFNRNGRGISLTTAGNHLLVYARSILQNLTCAQDALRSFSAAKSGSVIVAVPGLSARLTGDLIRRSKVECDGISLSLIEADTGKSIELLSNGVADIAILYNPPNMSTLNVEHLMNDHFVLLGALGSLSDHQEGGTTFESIRDLPLALPPRPDRLRAVLESAAQIAGTTLAVDLEITGVNTMLELVRCNLLHTIVPFGLVSTNSTATGFDIRRLSGIFSPLRLSVATSMQRPQTVATKTVLTAIRQQFREARSDPLAPIDPRSVGPDGPSGSFALNHRS